MIYVKNFSDNVVKVAISKWSSEEGNDEYIEINPEEVIKWDRSDKRGFLMSVVREDNIPELYSIQSDGYLIINNNNIENNGKEINYLYSIQSN
ncbi:hypothetical protein [Photorhabdus aegyptia]|uniref:hypothetical protein n=1 Tax=Photorhabdus aegyptia TaxID=2805098 RepID=UPI001E3600ED|nr:hypothetical protein [Photorhabdus aegyptia]MCC8459491.1 hypothetical protein [Photorhabdus aegyptia]